MLFKMEITLCYGTSILRFQFIICWGSHCAADSYLLHGLHNSPGHQATHHELISPLLIHFGTIGT